MAAFAMFTMHSTPNDDALRFARCVELYDAAADGRRRAKAVVKEMTNDEAPMTNEE